ncbi:MAG: hypothetical protein AAGD35_19735, partial [Actinomycetota bacterium]
MVHSARQLTSSGGKERLVEIHPVTDTAALDASIESLGRASALYEDELLTVLDVGRVADADAPPGVYLVTERWDEELAPGPHPEGDVLAIASAAGAGLAAIHRAGQHHGAVHRAAFRRVDERWTLSSAGLGPVLETELAPYRPPGLNVIEAPSPAADMWNLGIVLHELAAGRLLRPGETPNLPAAPTVQRVVASLLAAQPEQRPTARALVEQAGRGWSGPTAAGPSSEPAAVAGATRPVAPPSAAPAADHAAPGRPAGAQGSAAP